jgi:periplasmic divalent cation tolerance protein
VGLVQLITTVGTRDSALQLARAAVGERTAACVQIVGPITSVYRWKGEIEEATEFLLVMKTPAAGVERLTSFVRDRHPYDTPELTTIGSTFVDDRYLAWALEVTSLGTGPSGQPACPTT